MSRNTALLPLALVSLSVLALEVLLTKIISYSVSTDLLYVVLGIALLGFGAAGTMVSIWPRWLKDESIDRALCGSTLVAALAFIVCPALFVRMTPFLDQGNYLAFPVAAILTIPFFAAALVITLALSYSGGAPGRAYASNLIGSGLGCFVPLLLLGPVDGEGLLVLLAFLIWIASFIYLRNIRPSERGRLQWAVLISLPLIAISGVASHQVFPIQPEPEPKGQVSVVRRVSGMFGARMQKLYDRWNGTGRIEVFAFRQVRGAPDPYPYLFYAQDSSAGSLLLRWDGVDRKGVRPDSKHPWSTVSHFCEETIYSQAYYRERPRVLIIGLGGGPDLQCALYHRAHSVDVVEINPDSIALVKGPFNKWLGGVGSDDRVRFHNQDGRRFVHNTQNNGYDLIQLSGVDTKQGLASGSLALSQNNLYTREAFIDYLQNLNPNGVLSIIRFGEAEVLRLANTALWALRRIGVTNPSSNLSILQNDIVYGILVRRKHFPQAEVEALQDHIANRRFSGRPPFFYRSFYRMNKPTIPRFLPRKRLSGNVATFFSKVENGNTKGFIDAYPYNIQPTTDDRPFFFDSNRYDRGLSWINSSHIVILRDLAVSVVVLALALILLPVARRHSVIHTADAQGVKVDTGYSLVNLPLFFASIAFGYLLVEVWLLNCFSIYLGHQTRSLAVVLSSLLISSGIGAFYSERLVASYRFKAMLGCGITVVLLGFAMTFSFAFIELSWRADTLTRTLLTVLFVAPVGIAMGVPFVAGLSWIHINHPGATPWCIGINGFASVLATVVVIPLSLICGYSVVLLTGTGFYAMALVMAIGMRQKAT